MVVSESPARRRWLTALAAASVTWAVAIGGGSASGAQDGPAPFPVQLLAPVVSQGQSPELAIEAITREPADDGSLLPIFTIRFDGPFDLPSNGYRVAVVIGEPSGEQIRSSLVVRDGVPVGVIESGDGVTWTEQGTTSVEFLPEGLVRIQADLGRFGGEIDADAGAAEGGGGAGEDGSESTAVTAGPSIGSSSPIDTIGLWVTATEAPGASNSDTFRSPIFTLSEILGDGVEGQLTSALEAWIPDPDGFATNRTTELRGSPVLTMDGNQVIVTYTDRPPIEVDGAPVARLLDVVRIAPDFSTNGIPPFFVTIDHSDRVIKLWDGRGGLPIEMEADGPWVLEGLPAANPRPGERVVLDLDLLASAMGTPVSPDATAVGLTRSLTLIDERVIRPDGILATVGWFASAPDSPVSIPGAEAGTGDESDVTLADDEPSTTEATAPAGAAASEGPNLPLIAAAAGVVVVAVVVLAFMNRRRQALGGPPLWRRRGEVMMARPGPAPGAGNQRAEARAQSIERRGQSAGTRLAPGSSTPMLPTRDVSTEEQAELDEINEHLFGRE